MSKSEVLTVRLRPAVKQALAAAAAAEHRSLANMVEILVLSHCSARGIDVADSSATVPDKPRKSA